MNARLLDEQLHALLGDGANPGFVDLHGEIGAVQLYRFFAEVAARTFLDHIASLAPEPAQGILETASVGIGPQPRRDLIAVQALQVPDVDAHPQHSP